MTDRESELTTMEARESTDIADILSRLPAAGIDDVAMSVLEVYERMMQVYQPSERVYEATIRAGQAGNGFSATTNY